MVWSTRITFPASTLGCLQRRFSFRKRLVPGYSISAHKVQQRTLNVAPSLEGSSDECVIKSEPRWGAEVWGVRLRAVGLAGPGRCHFPCASPQLGGEPKSIDKPQRY